MDTTLSRPPAGQLLDGRYRVEAWLANGGMATVYLGTDTRLDRKVALKIAHPELAGDDEFIRRFMGEARSVARLSSPHVVAVYDQGADRQFLYLAMEYVPGRTLRELLRERGRLSSREALDIIEGALAGLAAAHDAGIVHRDVKPENVLLTTGNLVKVADFGLARAAAAASRTRSGMIIGTAAYLAPEQVSKSTSDARTDVYAAGIMLFELLTGTQPHTGGSPLDVAYKHVNDVVPAPSTVVPGLPAALDALVALATSRDPDLRPADAGQFLHAISEVRHGMPIGRPRGQHAAPNADSPDERRHPDERRYPDERSLPGSRSAAESAGAGSLAAPGLPGGNSLAGSGSPAAGGSARGGDSPGQAAARSWPDAHSAATRSWPDAHSAATRSWPDAHSAATRSWPDGRPGAAAAPSGPGVPDATAPALPLPWPGGGGASHRRNRRAQTSATSRLWPGGGRPGGTPPWPGEEPGGPGGIPPVAPIPADPHGGTNHTLIVSAGRLLDDGRDSPDRRRPRRADGDRRPGEPLLQRLLFSRRFVYLAGGLAVVLAITLLGWWLTSGRYTTVPQVRGMSASVARSQLTSLGFAVTTGPAQHSTTIPAGEIVRTSPAVGARSPRGSTIQLIVSLGPLKFPVPPVTGMPLATAEATLKKAGLTPGGVTQTTSPTIASGIVISTSPAAGVSWPQTSPVAIVVSDGPPLPSYVGQQLQASQAAATAAGYSLNPVPDAKSNQPAGTITSQSPAPGTPIYPHEVVTVHVSNGPPVKSIPNVQGMDVNQAARLLTAAGFNVTINSLGPGHRVISYSPTGQAPQGSTITLNVGFFFTLP